MLRMRETEESLFSHKERCHPELDSGSVKEMLKQVQHDTIVKTWGVAGCPPLGGVASNAVRA